MWRFTWAQSSQKSFLARAWAASLAARAALGAGIATEVTTAAKAIMVARENWANCILRYGLRLLVLSFWYLGCGSVCCWNCWITRRFRKSHSLNTSRWVWLDYSTQWGDRHAPIPIWSVSTAYSDDSCAKASTFSDDGNRVSVYPLQGSNVRGWRWFWYGLLFETYDEWYGGGEKSPWLAA